LFRFLLSKSSPYEEMSSFKIRDAMTKDVVTITRDTELEEAAHTMIGGHISSVVVVAQEDKPVGILTERDFIKKLDMKANPKLKILAADILSKDLVTLPSNESLFTAHSLMKQHNFRKVVVVDNNALSGIITQTDLCRAVARLKSRLYSAPSVASIMTSKVATVSPEDKFANVKRLMAQKDLGSVVIVDESEILGIFTEFDIVSEYYLNPNRLRNSYMSDFMTSPVVCITPDMNVPEANKIMLEKNFRRLPILDKGKLIGIITQTDVKNSLYDYLLKAKGQKLERPKNFKDQRIAFEKRGNIILISNKS
jgi:CBS domain-containing protein